MKHRHKELIEMAEDVLSSNDHGSFTVPSEGLYPHQVLWDSCFSAIGYSNYNLERAKTELLSLFRGQWSNGMIPHIVFTDSPKYESDKKIWRSRVSSYSPGTIATSGVSQPPMVAIAAERIGEKLSLTERKIWYESIYQQILAYHQWLYKDRDPNNTGLLVQLHPWETGLDNTPHCLIELHNHPRDWWIRFLDYTNLIVIGDWFRTDTKYVPAGQRSSSLEALEFYNLLRKLRKNKFLARDILTNPAFAIEDLTYNCILIRANDSLMNIATTIGQDLPKSLKNNMNMTIKSLDSFYDIETNQYYSRTFKDSNLIKESSVATFMPLFTKTISKERAQSLVRLLDNKDFFNTPFPVPTLPINSKWFTPKKYWQGATWININWFIIDGLRHYGFNQQADLLIRSTLKLVDNGGFHEYFDPLNGEAAGADNFSWTAGLFIDLFYDRETSGGYSQL